jgi:hypothetical protein
MMLATHALPTRDRGGLDGCIGFRVEGPWGRAGIVEEIRAGAGGAEPDRLVVRTNPYSGEWIAVSVGDVAEIDPVRGLVRLRRFEADRTPMLELRGLITP